MRTIKQLSLLSLATIAVMCSCQKDEPVGLNYERYSLSIGETRSVDYLTTLDSDECMGIVRPTDCYTYPYLPGTDAWNELHNQGLQVVHEACKIPEDILRILSTEAVVQAFFDFPFISEIYAYNSMLEGFNSMTNKNSAYAEILKRDDVASILVERYVNYKAVGCDAAIYHTPELELLLAQPEIYNMLDKNQCKEIVKEALNKISARLNYDPELKWLHINTCLMMGRLMLSAGYEDFKEAVSGSEALQKYLDSQDYSFQDYELIILNANNY